MAGPVKLYAVNGPGHNLTVETKPVLQIRNAQEIICETGSIISVLYVSPDGENWRPLKPYRRVGSKKHWLTTSEDHFIRADYQFADNPTESGLVLNLDSSVRQVKIEQFNEATGTWEMYEIAHLNGETGHFIFSIPQAIQGNLNNLRISTSDQTLLPYDFASGQTEFDDVEYEYHDISWGDAIAIGGEIITLIAGDSVVGCTATVDGSIDIVASDVTSNAPITIQESDIWKVSGNRIFYYTSSKGLHIIDATIADEPHITHFWKNSGIARELYLADENCAIIIGDHSVRALLIHNDLVLPSMPVGVKGTIIESRLVDDRLYIASREHVRGRDATTGAYVSRYYLHLTAIDFSDQEHPEIIEEIQFHDARRNAVISADDNFLMLALQEESGLRSQVYLFATGRPGQPFFLHQQIRTLGIIRDKFKLYSEEGYFYAISEVIYGGPRISCLESFLLKPRDGESLFLENELELARQTMLDESFLYIADPSRVGHVMFGQSERLYATRFDGDRAYVVTFRNIDPLWVIDLSDPANLSIDAELEIPGYSTYLHPVGDRLIAVGLEGDRVTVSLFNVTDPAFPSMIKRLYLGMDQYTSSSEAIFDEKAISVIPEENLLLLPFSETSSWNVEDPGKLQLIDFSDEDLQLRGIVESPSALRRATALNGRVATVSEHELFMIDISNRDDPLISAALDLNNPVSRVFVEGDYLFKIDKIEYRSDAPRLQISPVSNPHMILAEAILEAGRYTKYHVQDGFLYQIVEKNHSITDESGQSKKINSAELFCFDLRNPLEVIPCGTIVLEEYQNGWMNNFTFSSLDGDVLLIAEHRFGDDLEKMKSSMNGSSCNTVTFYCLDTVDKSDLQLLSVTPIESYRKSVAGSIWGKNYYQSGFSGFYQLDQAIRLGITEQSRFGGKQHFRYFFRDIDFCDPLNPVIRKYHRLPGQLVIHQKSGTQSGHLMFSLVPGYVNNYCSIRGKSRLQASVFDGHRVYMVDEIELSGIDAPDLLVHNRVIYELASENLVANDSVPPPENDLDVTAVAVHAGIVIPAIDIYPGGFWPCLPSHSIDPPNTVNRIEFTNRGKFERKIPLLSAFRLHEMKIAGDRFFVFGLKNREVPGLWITRAGDQASYPDILEYCPDISNVMLHKLARADSRYYYPGGNLGLLIFRIDDSILFPNPVIAESPLARIKSGAGLSILEWRTLPFSATSYYSGRNITLSGNPWQIYSTEPVSLSPSTLRSRSIPQTPLFLNFAVEIIVQSDSNYQYLLESSSDLENWTELTKFSGSGFEESLLIPTDGESAEYYRMNRRHIREDDEASNR